MMRAGGCARLTACPIKIREEPRTRGEIGPRSFHPFLRYANRAYNGDDRPGRRRDPHETSHPERPRAGQSAPACQGLHCKDVPVDHKARNHEEQVDPEAPKAGRARA